MLRLLAYGAKEDDIVLILHMDRKIQEGREFGWGQEHELVDFIKKHPILNDKLLFCKGIG